jgi:hypothetical protein
MELTISNKRICEAVDCECEATEQVEISAGKHGFITLFVCNNCISKFNSGSAVQTKEERKRYHLMRLQKLSEYSLENIPYLHEPTDEQKEWVLHRLKQPTKYWRRWFVSQYFTREQKALMGLTDKDIAGKGIK